MAKKKIIKKTAKRITQRFLTPKENAELVFLRAENEALRENISIYEQWYSVPKPKLLELIKLARGI